MSIDSLRSGAIRICFDSSLNAYPSKCRILLEGQMLDTGTAKDGELIKIPALRDVDLLFGAGSVIANGLKVGFGCCPNQAMEFFALPRKDASVNATIKAVYEIKFEQNITSSGRVDLFIGDGRWNTSTRVLEGMKDDDVAAAVVLSLQGLVGFPYDVEQGSAAAGTGEGNIVRLTAKNAGTVGNNLSIINNWHQRRDYAPVNEGSDTPFEVLVSQTVVGANGGTPQLDYSAVLGECCYCCIGMLYDEVLWQDQMIAYIATAWACEKPQCFGHGYTYNSGTFGQIMACDTNSAEVSRLAHCGADPVLGYLKVAAYAAQSCCSTVNNPEMNIEGPNFGVLSCVRQPESCFQCFTFDEQQILQASGFVVTVPLSGGAGSLTSPMIVNDITNNRFDADGKLNATWWNTSARRLAAATADAAAIALNQVVGLGLFTKNTTIPRGIKGTNPRMILGAFRAWAKSQIGVLFSEFDNIDRDIRLQTDFERAPRCQGIPGKLFIDFTYRPPVRISTIIIGAKPSLLTNC
jgi:phage tail sheath gpL-like